MDVPKDLKYSKEHEWVRLEGDIGTVGITNYAQEQLGDIVYIELPEVGQEVSAMQQVGSIESVKTVSDLFTPVAGRVIELNQILLDRIEGKENPDFHPEVVNQEPYGRGWMFKVRLGSPSGVENLLDAEGYEKLITNKE